MWRTSRAGRSERVGAMGNLTRREAASRAALVDGTAYRVRLDLDRGDATFDSTTTITFGCREPGSSTFLDLRADAVRAITVNGKPIDPVVVDDRVELTDLAADNEVVVSATMRYSRDGQGLHRAVDPADGRHYVFGHLFLDAAPRVFACFDQPDLKAPFDIEVSAPEGWTVMGNGAATQVSPGQWRLATTLPLPTYIVTVCAGPWATVTDEHDGIPLRIHARESLREPLERQAAQMFEVTKASFDHYHGLFGIRYPFGEYHQVFVPEFNAGAMENPGCVTFRDQLLFRGAVSREELLRRSGTIAHEMAHMWFGDLVTMAWWDDLWLNESFAEYMAQRTLMAATEFTDAAVDAAMKRKVWGHTADRMPSTHPVAGAEAPDVETALQNFDGISYAKGAAVLRQLIVHIGDEAFVTGVTAYLQRHRFGNADLADFLRAMEEASGRDLAPWARAWLRTPGLDTLAVATENDGDVLAAATVLRTPPEQHPADRPHTFEVAGYAAGEELFRTRATVAQDRTELPELVGRPAPTVTVPNASDLTWATVRLDESTLAALPDELAVLPSAADRAVVWTALLDGVSLAEVDPRHLLRVFAAAWPHEQNDSVLAHVAELVSDRVIPAFLVEHEQEAGHQLVAGAARRLLAEAPPGSSAAFVAARTLAGNSDDVDLLTRWAAGESLPEGLAGDSDFRWIAVRNLAERGVLEDGHIDRALTLDDTTQGRLSALVARASRPDATAKSWAWDQLAHAEGRTNYELYALAVGFWRGGRPDLLRPYVERYFTDVPRLRGRVGEDALAQVANLSYPSVLVDDTVHEATTTALARDDLSAAVRRAMVDQQALLGQALRSRERFGGDPLPV